jgi:AcrR family transcriptional regulator
MGASKEKTRKYDSAVSKEKIKKAAVLIFSQKGLKATTVRMIASKAGVNLAMIDRYFGGKTELFEFVMKEFLANKRSQELSYAPQDDLRTEISLFLGCAMEETERVLSFARILISQALVEPKYKKMFEDVLVGQEDSRLFDRLNLLKERGLVPSHLDTSVLTSIVCTQVAKKKKKFAAKQIQRIPNFLLKIILAHSLCNRFLLSPVC